MTNNSFYCFFPIVGGMWSNGDYFAQSGAIKLNVMSFVTTWIPFRVLLNSKLFFANSLITFLSLVRLTWGVRMIGGGLPDPLVSVCCCSRWFGRSAPSSPAAASTSTDRNEALKFLPGIGFALLYGGTCVPATAAEADSSWQPRWQCRRPGPSAL